MKTQVMTVTPMKAAEWLEKCNTHNRNINRKRVEQYAADMKAGSWLLTHQGIAFDEDGVLCDGQHRLSAQVLSGVTLQWQVTRGLPPVSQNGVAQNVRDVMDRGQGRSLGQQLGMSHGIKYSVHVAGMLRAIAAICVGYAMNLSTAQALKILALYGNDIEQIIGLPWAKNSRKTSLLGALAFAMIADRDKVLEFARGLATMENIPAKSPVHALHRWLQNTSTDGGSRIEHVSRSVASCVCRYIDGLPAEKVSGSEESLKRLRAAQKGKIAKVLEIMGVTENRNRA